MTTEFNIGDTIKDKRYDFIGKIIKTGLFGGWVQYIVIEGKHINSKVFSSPHNLIKI